MSGPRESRKNPEELGKRENLSKVAKSFQANVEDRGIFYRRDPERPAEETGGFCQGLQDSTDMDNPPLSFPRNAVFSRYTRHAATTRANIDDFGDWSRYTEPLQALHAW